MARRTTVNKVKEILGGNYGTVNGVLTDLDPFIDMATAVVDQVVALTARQTSPITLTMTNYELMERWTAAYFYSMLDPLLSSKSTEGASGSFVQEKLDQNRYKAGAIMADPTGILNALLNRTVASSTWLGKTKSEQLSYDDRNE